MLFNSRLFILGFLPLTLAGFWAMGRLGRKPALAWLLGCSLAFYAWWKPPFLLLLLASILVNFAVSEAMRALPAPRRWMIAGLAFNLLLLGFFKYAGFFCALCGLKPPFGGVFLPLGISFFTFQQIMFLVDRACGAAGAVAFLDYACFIAFFPHLIAGPIVRPGHILPQFLALRPAAAWRDNLAAGAELFLLGLAKKLVLADALARFADPGFLAASRLEPLTLIEAWVALLAYGGQIYFDFSGYSDMAIGLARMFGIRFPMNFNSPYQARNISEFWRRWNITLSGFLRDYLYIPLGGNRRGEARRVANLFVTMLLGGLWHGAALRFVLWGGLHGVFLVVHGWARHLPVRLPRLASRAITLLCVLLAWVPFRAASFAATLDFTQGLLGLHGIALPVWLGAHMPGWVHQVPVLPYLGEGRSMSLPQGALLLGLAWWIALCLKPLQQMSARRRGAALLASFGFSAQALFYAPAALPFLYFQF